MKVEAFGRELLISREGEKWVVYDLGSEGKKRPASDIVIPATVLEPELVQYLGDLLHEYASLRNPEVKIVD